jgi:hypothetical protein
MPKRKLLLATLWLAATASIAPVVGSAAVNIDIDVAPPAPRVEEVPGPRPGWVWAPGYWQWEGHQHWVPDAWVGNGPHYHFVRGHWDR